MGFYQAGAAASGVTLPVVQLLGMMVERRRGRKEGRVMRVHVNMIRTRASSEGVVVDDDDDDDDSSKD